jgi:cytochrome c oxidase cbb3-type subunit 3/ubiquinol-cytochrome c reductase cytochrome c subunit
MNSASRTLSIIALSAAIAVSTGCKDAPGYPKGEAQVSRPDKELNFEVLYKQNCAGCHGDDGRNGAAIPLRNAAYLAVAGADNLRAATARGVSGTLMPGFARGAGGMLTSEQVEALVQGMMHSWAHPAEFAGLSLPPYSSSTPGNAGAGRAAYAAACSRCHGADGTGTTNSSHSASPPSIVDASYLALVSDQSLRSIVIAGHPGTEPDWRSYITGPQAHALSAKEIEDIVAWIAAHRTKAGEQAESNQHDSALHAATKEAQ